jgi:hypothetical protein
VKRIPILALLLLAAPAVAAPLPLRLEGVLGEPIALGPPAQARTTIVFFMSRATRDESAAFARAVDEQLLTAPVESIGIVDMHRYGGLLRGLAMSALRRATAEGRQRRRERREAHRVDASPTVVDRWHMVGDFDGTLFDRFGVGRDPAHPVAFVLDRAGGLHGPFRDAASLVSACPDAFSG